MTEMLQCHPVLALHKKKIVPAAIFFGNTQDVYKKYIHAQMARWSPIDQKVLFITSAGCSKETKDMILEEVQKYKNLIRSTCRRHQQRLQVTVEPAVLDLFICCSKIWSENSIDILRKRVILRHIKIEYDLQGRV